MRIESFIMFLHSLEQFNQVNIFYLGNSSQEKLIPVEGTLPRIIIDFPSGEEPNSIKGLMREEGTKKIFKLGLIFNLHSLTVVFLSEYTTHFEALKTIMFQADSKVLLVYDKFIDATLLEKFSKIFINLLAINSSEFESTSRYFAFEIFPEFKLVERGMPPEKHNPFKDHLSNVHEHLIKVSCPNEIPNCMVTVEDGILTSKDGIMLNILEDFA